jgi:hypothetical protein
LVNIAIMIIVNPIMVREPTKKVCQLCIRPSDSFSHGLELTEFDAAFYCIDPYASNNSTKETPHTETDIDSKLCIRVRDAGSIKNFTEIVRNRVHPAQLREH